jgi:CheY-like chemotaxis protein
MQRTLDITKERENLEAALATPIPALRLPRVLLADDSDEMRSLIAGMLRQAGYEVVEARDGIELFEHIESAVASGGRRNPPISLVISDVRMPGLSGLSVLGILRCGYWRTPVILITAFGDEHTHAEARELGAAALFDKPFDLDELRRTVQRLVPTWG